MEAVTVQTVHDLERETTLPRKRKYTSKACVGCRKLKIRCKESVAEDGTPSCEHCVKSGSVCSWPKHDARKWSKARPHRQANVPVDHSPELIQDSLPHPEATLQKHEDDIEPPDWRASDRVHGDPNTAAGASIDGTPHTVLQYYRYLGSTAIAPGYKKISLKATKDIPEVSDQPHTHSEGDELVDARTSLPRAELLPHLLDAFFRHYGGNFCFLNRQQLETLIETNEISSFLLCSLAALSARFCDPEIFYPYFPSPNSHDTDHWRNSLPFLLQAKKLLMPLLSIPSCDLVAGLLFLALAEFGDNNEAGMWIFTGMSMRVAQELGLHRQRPAIYSNIGRSPTSDQLIGAESVIQSGQTAGRQGSSPFDESSQILLFWCCYLQDVSLANGTGRVPSIRESEISIRLPTDHDIDTVKGGNSERTYIFPHMIRLMLGYARSIEFLNLADQTDSGSFGQRRKAVETIHDIKDHIMSVYDALPLSAKYGVWQYQQASDNGDAIPYLILHLNFHLQIAFLTQACQAIELQLPRSSLDQQYRDEADQPNGASIHDGQSLAGENQLYRKAIKSIVDILTIARFIDTTPLLSTFFLNQSLFHAACAYAGDMLRFQHHSSQQFSLQDHMAAFPLPSPLSTSVVFDLDELRNAGPGRTTLSSTDAYLALLAKTNYQFLRQSITEMAKYYAGAAWVDAVLDQRENGIRDVDLSIVSESICTYVRLHDLRATHGAASKNPDLQQPQNDDVFGAGGLMLTEDLLSTIAPDFDSQAFFNDYIFAGE